MEGINDDELVELLKKSIRENGTLESAVIGTLSGILKTQRDIKEMIQAIDKRLGALEGKLDRTIEATTKRHDISATERKKGAQQEPAIPAAGTPGGPAGASLQPVPGVHGARKPEFLYKIGMCGHEGMDKTSILQNYASTNSNVKNKNVVGVDFLLCRLERHEKRVILFLWDFGNQERFKNAIYNYISNTRGGIIFFNMAKIETLETAKDWIDIYKTCAPGIPIILVGTDSDLVDEGSMHAVLDAANAVARKHGLHAFIPTSATTGTNIDEPICTMADLMLAEAGVLAKHG